ncbi:Ig-like domain-containing protein [Streptococcus nidrosiense]|uniref:Ig-like domain-containing protein n=2 Tax=Bacteria TaxID=2 RepID=UPI0035CF874F
MFDKDGNKIGEGVADENGKAKITPTVDIPEGNVTAKATKDGQTSDASAPKEATAATPAKPSTPVVDTDLTGKAGTKTPVEVTAEPGTKVELFDKDGNKIGEGVADENGKAKITPTVDIPEGNVTAKATKDGQTSDASAPKEATAATPAKPSTPVVDTDLTGKAGTKTPVEVTAEPGTKVELFDKDGNKIGEGVADENGKAKITPTVDIPEGNVTAKATKDGQTSDASAPKEATAATPAKPSTPVVDTDLTGKAGTKTPVEVTAEPGSTVALYDKDGNKIGEGTAGPDGKVTITPDVDIPAGPVTAKATKDGQTSDASTPKEATAATPAKPSQPVVDTDLAGKAGTKTPVEVTAEPGSTVALYDKDGNKIGEGTAGPDGKVTITPDVDIPAGPVTAKATKDGQTSDASTPKEATAATPAKPSTPVVDTDLTGKAGTKTPVEVTAEPGSTVALYDKDGNKIGEGTAGPDGKVTITPDVDIPAGPVTAKATKDGQTSDASTPKEATAATPAKPSTPVVDTDLTGKAGTKTPVEVTAEPGTKVELFDKDGNKIGEGVADENGKAKITPTVDIPEGNVTAKATKDGQTSDASAPKEATAATPAKPSQPVVDTDLAGKAGTKTPVEVTAEPGSTVALYDKDGNKIGEGTAGPDGKVTITPDVDIPAGPVTAKATKDGQTSDASTPKEATAATPAKPSQPVVDTDLAGKAGTKTPVEVTAKPGSTVALYDKDGNKIGEGTAGPDGKVTITPDVDIPAGPVIAKATKDGQTSDASTPKEATAATPAKPSQPVVDTDLAGKAGTKTPVEVTAEPGSKVEMYDKDGNKIGEGVADENGKATITPTVDIPEGNVTVVASKDGQTPEASDPVQATTPSTPDTTAPAKPVVTTDLTGKAGTKTPVEVTAEPGSTVKLFDKDGNKIGEGVADNNGKATITPTVDLPAGGVTATATDPSGNVSDPSDAATATTPSTPDTTAPAKPVVTTDLTGKAGTKTPVEVTAEPGSTVKLFDKDGNKIGEGVADNNGKATIIPTVDIPAGGVTATATDPSGNVSDPSDTATVTTQPEITTDLTGKAGTKTPVEVTAEPGSKVEMYDKDGNKIGEGVADENGKATITPTVDIPEGNVTVVASKDGQTPEASDPVQATTPSTPDTTAPAKPVVTTDLTGKAGTKTPVEVTAEPGSTVKLFDKDGNKIGEGVADNNGKATITPTVDIPAGGVTATATDPSGNTSDASEPKETTAATPSDKAVKDPSVTPVTDPSNLTDAEKAKVSDEVKKSNPTVSKVEVGNDGTATVTYPDGTTAVIPADKTVKKSDDKVVTDPSVTPVTDSSNLTDAEKAKVSDEVEKSNPTVSKVEVGNDGTTTVTYPDGTTAVIPADKTVKKSDDKVVKDPSVTPVTDPSNLTDAEKGKVADEVKKSNPTVTDVKVDKDGTTTVTYPDGTTAVIPADKTVKKSDDKGTKDPSVTPVTNPSNLTDAEKAKVAEEVKKANPTVTDVKVDNDGTTTVTYPDGTTAVIPADKTVKKSADKSVKDPSVTPVTDPSNLTDAEKAKVADEVKKSNPTVSKVEVGNDGTTTVTYPDGTTAVIPADKTVKKSSDKSVKDPSVTPVTDPSNLTDAEKAKVADEVKKSNPTVSKVEVGNDGTTTVTYPDGTTAVIPADKTVKKSSDKSVKDPSVTPVTDPSNLTDAEKAKVADEVKKSNPTVSKVEVGNDGTTTVTYPDGTTAVIPADKTVKKSSDKSVKDPSVTPVTDPSNLTDAEKAKVADEVKKSNPTVSKVEVGNDGTTTVTYPDGTTAVVPADKTVKKSDDKAVKDPSVTPVTDPSNLTDAEKAKVADEVKKSNPTVSKVEVGNDGTTTVTYPDGTTAVIPADKTVKKSADKVVTNPSVTPVTDPSNLTDAEKAKVADEVKKANPTAKDIKVNKDGSVVVTFEDGTTAVIPADKTVKKSADKVVTNPSVTPVTDPSNLTDAEKAKVAEEVKKANPTAKDIKVNKDGSVVVTFEDGTTAVIPADKTVKKSADKVVTNPSVTPVTDPSNLTDAEKAKVADEVKKANPTAKDIKVNKDGSVVVTFEDGTTAVIPADKTVKKSSDKAKESDGVKNPSVTPVTDPSNLTDAEKAKVADEVKKANPTAKDIKVNKDGSVVVTFEDGTTAVIPADKTVKKSSDKAKESDGVKNPSVTPVTDPSNLTDAEKAKVADEVKKANPTAKDIKVNKDGSVVVTFEDGTTAVIPADKTVKKSSDKAKESDGVKNPSVTPVTDPSNLTDAEKAKVADEVKKANPTATDVKVNNDGSVVVTFADGSVATIAANKVVKEATKESSAQAPAKKAGAKELPNTGTKQSSASLGLALLAAVTGGLLIAKKREEEE